MIPKIPIVTEGLKKRLWSIIIIVMAYLIYTALGDTIPRYWEMIGSKSLSRTILTLGGIVILLICLSGLAVSEKLSIIIISDELTGLCNKSYIRQRLQEELYRSERYNHPFSLLMIDLDDFKSFNDKYGHTVGDYLLKSFADLIKKEIRRSDIAARYGGDEFLIILPESTSQEAFCVAERLRQKIASYPFRIDTLQGTTIRFTISAGLCSFPEYKYAAEKLISSADAALYQAKKNGKNKVTSYRQNISAESCPAVIN